MMNPRFPIAVQHRSKKRNIASFRPQKASRDASSDSFGTKIRKSEISYGYPFEPFQHKVLIDRHEQRIMPGWHATCLQSSLVKAVKSQKPLQRILLPRQRRNIWIGSERPQNLSIFLLTFPKGEESDQSQSVAQSTFNVATMATLGDCAPLLNR